MELFVGSGIVILLTTSWQGYGTDFDKQKNENRKEIDAVRIIIFYLFACTYICMLYVAITYRTFTLLYVNNVIN